MDIIEKQIVEPKKRKKPNFSRFKEAHWFKQFDEKVKSGIAPIIIAKFIQRDMGDMLDYSEKNLVERIRLYRKHLPPGSYKVARKTVLERHTETFERDICELEELKSLYLLQTERIGFLYDRERDSKMAFPETREEMAFASALLLKIKNLKTESGFYFDTDAQTPQSQAPTLTDDDIKLGMVAHKLREAFNKLEEPKAIEAKFTVEELPKEIKKPEEIPIKLEENKPVIAKIENRLEENREILAKLNEIRPVLAENKVKKSESIKDSIEKADKMTEKLLRKWNI